MNIEKEATEKELLSLAAELGITIFFEETSEPPQDLLSPSWTHSEIKKIEKLLIHLT